MTNKTIIIISVWLSILLAWATWQNRYITIESGKHGAVLYDTWGKRVLIVHDGIRGGIEAAAWGDVDSYSLDSLRK
jgi:hypothetical protein